MPDKALLESEPLGAGAELFAYDEANESYLPVESMESTAHA